ncbi:MAG TPA: adenylate kinase [Terriglobia bacterium]|jgi:adenylate kinase|nr:adenylate kinase [Terriglobia bacterium]
MAQILIFLGPPGAGKGTQARVVARKLGIPHISTGDILREAAAKRTGLGLAAKAKMDKGELVPDDVISPIVEERLSRPDCRNGAILDGFPRTIAQAEFLDRILKRTGLGEPLVLNLQVETDSIIRRLTGRRTCSTCGEIYNIHVNPPRQDEVCDKDGGKLIQRADDNEDAIRIRLKAYEQDTLPLIDYYEKKHLLRHVDGSGSPEEITERLLSLLKQDDHL